MSSEEIRIPQPDELSSREKEDAMGAYFMMFAAWAIGLPLPVLNLIAAFIYFMIHRKKSRFVAFHSHQSLISQLPVTAANLITVVWLINIVFTGIRFGSFYFPSRFFAFLGFMVVLNILYLVYSIIALLKARKGQFFYMPLFGRLSFGLYYGPNAKPLEKPVEPNRPPEGF
jgi:uncharacterized Tic20 family protein